MGKIVFSAENAKLTDNLNWTYKNLHFWNHNCDMHPKICTYFTVTPRIQLNLDNAWFPTIIENDFNLMHMLEMVFI